MNMAKMFRNVIDFIRKNCTWKNIVFLLKEYRFFWYIFLFQLLLTFFESLAISSCGLIKHNVLYVFYQAVWFYVFLTGLSLMMCRIYGKIFLSIVTFLHTVCVIFAVYFAVKFEMPINKEAFFILAASSVQETKEFLTSYVSPVTWGLVLLSSAALFALLFGLFKHKFRFTWLAFFAGLFLLLPYSAKTVRYCTLGHYQRIYNSSTMPNVFFVYKDYCVERDKVLKMVKNPVLPSGIRKMGSDNVLGVIIIGESATRNHWSAYGYPRKTTPEISSLPAEEALLFQDVIASMPHTVPATRHILTDATLQNPEFHYSVVDVLKNAGYRVIVISNQMVTGVHDTPVTALMYHAHQHFYTNTSAISYDGKILPHLDEQIKNSKTPTVIVIHLMGSHMTFHKRYPQDFGSFSKVLDESSQIEGRNPRRINEYDNSIQYTDMLLGKIIKNLRTLDRPVFMLYFSDHGESPGFQGTARSPTSTNPDCYEIPFLLWANEPYRRNHSVFWGQAAKNVAMPMQMDIADWAILSAARITFDGFQYKDDLFSEKFIPRKNRVMGTKKVPYDPQ